MRSITVLLSISLQRLNAAEYLNLMSRLEELIETATAAGVGLTEEEKAEFSALVDKLRKRVNYSTASSLTSALDALEKQRDSLLTYLFAIINNGVNLPIAALSEAAKALELLIRPYKDTQSLPDQQETVVIEGLLRDLDEATARTNLAALNLTAVAEELKSVNGQFATLTRQRAEEAEAKNMASETVMATRERLDPVFNAIQIITQAESVAKPTEVTAAFIRNFNAALREVKRLNSIRLGGSKEEGEREPTVIPGTDPDEGTGLPFEPVDPDEGDGGEEETPDMV